LAAGKKRGNAREAGAPSPSGGKGRRIGLRPKSCAFCKQKIELVDYKDIGQLRRYLSERGRIRSRAHTGACRRHQAQLATAIKRAREMALLPYIGDAGPPANRPRSHSDR
jgi:small subunit ribosomal protein S18